MHANNINIMIIFILTNTSIFDRYIALPDANIKYDIHIDMLKCKIKKKKN